MRAAAREPKPSPRGGQISGEFAPRTARHQQRIRGQNGNGGGVRNQDVDFIGYRKWQSLKLRISVLMAVSVS